MGNASDSIDAFNSALEQDANFIDAHFHKGIALDSVVSVNDAILEFDRSLEIDPDLRPHIIIVELLFQNLAGMTLRSLHSIKLFH